MTPEERKTYLSGNHADTVYYHKDTKARNNVLVQKLLNLKKLRQSNIDM